MPKVLSNYIIDKLHETHIGNTKILKMNEQIIYLSGILSNIKNCIEKYEVYKKFSRTEIKELLI